MMYFVLIGTGCRLIFFWCGFLILRRLILMRFPLEILRVLRYDALHDSNGAANVKHNIKAKK